MWRVALFCSVLTLTVACGEGPNAPSLNTDRLPRLQEGDPPPPPLEGGGFVTFSPRGVDISATDIVPQQVCEPPVLAFAIEGNYFRNKTDKLARIHFVPVPGSGAGTIHETASNPDATASGTLVVIGPDLQQYEIHLRDYTGPSLFTFDDSFGNIAGSLVAEVVACGEPTAYIGAIDFFWSCPDCGKDF